MRAFPPRVCPAGRDLIKASPSREIANAHSGRAREAAAMVIGARFRYRQHEGSLTIHETSRNVARYRAEHVAIAEKLLADRADTSGNARVARLHTRESAALAAESCFAEFDKQRVGRRGCRKKKALAANLRRG